MVISNVMVQGWGSLQLNSICHSFILKPLSFLILLSEWTCLPCNDPGLLHSPSIHWSSTSRQVLGWVLRILRVIPWYFPSNCSGMSLTSLTVLLQCISDTGCLSHMWKRSHHMSGTCLIFRLFRSEVQTQLPNDWLAFPFGSKCFILNRHDHGAGSFLGYFLICLAL